jgi:quercetin dioxygenase-like cupin family protein
MSRHSVVGVVAALLFVSPAAAQDAVKVDPAHHTVEFENAQVRVLRITFGPGEKAPLHQHPAGVAVFLTDHQATVLPDGGTPDPTPRKRGEVLAIEASKHTVENRGTARSEVVVIELKAAAPGGMLEQDAVKLDPKHYSVVTENDRVRVLRIRYGPKEKSVLHGHWPGVAVMLTAGTTRFHDAAGKATDQKAVVGGVNWETGDAHLPENLEDRPFEVVLVELKPAAR